MAPLFRMRGEAPESSYLQDKDDLELDPLYSPSDKSQYSFMGKWKQKRSAAFFHFPGSLSWSGICLNKGLLAELCLLVLAVGLLSFMVMFAKPFSETGTRGCTHALFGWVETSHHAFGASESHHTVEPRDYFKCNRYVVEKSGFCLCNLTSIALPAPWGHGPVNCENACRESRRVGTPLPKCKQVKGLKDCRVIQEGDLAPSGYRSAAKKLHADFYEARGNEKKIGAVLPGWRSKSSDFVVEGLSLSDADVQKMVAKVKKFKESQPKYPHGMYQGKGIVIVGGSGKFETPYWIAVHSLRRTGCTLPIEVWFPEDEVPTCDKKKELSKLDVVVRSFADLDASDKKKKNFVTYKSKAKNQHYNYMYKVFALTFSSFEEVIMLDSDIVSLRNPEFLFESRAYVEHGSLFWKDFWNSSSAPDCQRILGPQTLLQHSHESGQMLVNKSRTWDGLMFGLYMNSFPKFFYPLTVNYMGYGDKETLPIAFLHVGLRYGIVDEGPDLVGHLSNFRSGVIGNTMLQHCPAGNPLFLHANMGKMHTFVPETWDNYVRRWQTSVLHSKGVINLIEEHAGTDLEKWLHELITENHCLFSSVGPKLWHHRLGIGPLYDGFSLLDHPNLNSNLAVTKKLLSEGYELSNTPQPM
ncbi:alpha-mannosyltransferase [Chloropicon primus]|uniref:Alpha-mannosyltransferase n=1 Tax=Chloropicon primus TaxID=1764295 RepID=A0A5B8MPU9_9CHLO|nr:alpha-mannosyltransferase [Chloropicon primus]|eukprot:QDZ22698.1 alpha-mannosyltransferase [Chloropicon primus]